MGNRAMYKDGWWLAGTVSKVVFDVKPHPSAQDEDELHATAEHGHAAHGLAQ